MPVPHQIGQLLKCADNEFFAVVRDFVPLTTTECRCQCIFKVVQFAPVLFVLTTPGDRGEGPVRPGARCLPIMTVIRSCGPSLHLLSFPNVIAV